MGKSKPARNADEAPPLWFGALFIAVGACVAALGGGWIPVDPASVHAPGWVIVLAGLVFAMGGAMCYTQQLGENFNDGLVLVILGSFAMIGSWIAFDPGEREFSGSGSIGPIGIGGPAGDGLGRAVFGIGALLTWAVTAAVFSRLVRRLMAAS